MKSRMRLAALSVSLSIRPMENKDALVRHQPVPITDAEFEELVECEELREGYLEYKNFGVREQLADEYIVKFPDYITDGPGYAGPLIVIISGIMTTAYVTRDKDNQTLHVQWGDS